MVHFRSISSCLNGCVMVYTVAIQGLQGRPFGTSAVGNIVQGLFFSNSTYSQTRVQDAPALGCDCVVHDRV